MLTLTGGLAPIRYYWLRKRIVAVRAQAARFFGAKRCEWLGEGDYRLGR